MMSAAKREKVHTSFAGSGDKPGEVDVQSGEDL
jgi:hypothetical protein